MRKTRYKAIEKANARLFKHEWNKPEKKIFASKYIEHENIELHDAIKEINNLRATNPESYRFNLKKAANLVREATGFNCMIGFAFATRVRDGAEVLLTHFFPEVEVTQDNFYDMYIDEVSNKPYLLLKKEGRK